MRKFCSLLAVTCLVAPAWAGAPKIVDATVQKTGMTWRVDVTLQHDDTGWDHFADGWDVTDADGNVLGHRELLHPHVAEQPFTRSLSNLIVPDGTREVFIRARCSVAGWSGESFKVRFSP